MKQKTNKSAVKEPKMKGNRKLKTNKLSISYSPKIPQKILMGVYEYNY